MTKEFKPHEQPGVRKVGLAALRPANKPFYDDAPAVLKALRESGAVVRDDAAKVWLVSSYEAARSALTDRSLWRGQEKGEPSPGRDKLIRDAFSRDPVTGEPVSYSITQMDDPDHSRVRGLLAAPLYARVTNARSQVQVIVDDVLDRLQDKKEFELISEFATPIPIRVIAEILGVDARQWERFREWSEGIASFINSSRTDTQETSFQDARVALVGFFSDMIRERRRAPKNDLISDYAALQPSGANVSDAEIMTNLITLLTAGNLTTSDLIGSGVHLLLTHPSAIQKLRTEPDSINRIVEEVLRFEPPLDITVRIASQDLELNGCPIRERQNLTLLLRAANRDPAQFENPETFDVTRAPRPHLAFGGGTHLCLGAPLARLEANVAFTRLFEYFPNLRLATPDVTPPRRMLPFVNGFERYMVQTS